MSNTPFVESLSEDPVVKAIARKVQRILNDTSLDRKARETLVRKAQRELIEHRQRQEQHHKLLQQVAALKLPRGYRAHCVAIRDGQVQVGGLNRQHGFTWLEAGQAPKGVPANQPAFQLPRPPKAVSGVRKDLAQSLVERRKALGYGHESTGTTGTPRA